MNFLKCFIKKHFTGFAYFYRHIGPAMFLAFGLSIAVSFLDGMGLAMFLPLLEVVGGDDAMRPVVAEPGFMQILTDGLAVVGIPLTLVSVLAFMVLFFGLKGVSKYVQEVYLVILQQRFIRDVRLHCVHLLNRMSFRAFTTADVGRIQNTLTGEVDRVSSAFRAYFLAFQQGVMVAVYMVFAFAVDSRFALLVCLGGGVTNLLYRSLFERTRNASRKLTRFNSLFQGEIIQHIAHFKYLKASGRVADYEKRLEDSIHKVEQVRRRIGTLNSVAQAAREPLLVVVVAMVIYVQVRFFGGAMGALVISLLFFYRALMALMQMQQSWINYLQFSGSIENIRSFQQDLSKSEEEDGTRRLEGFSKGIELKGVGFSYGDKKVLEDITFTLPKNTSLALVGESGSGKTTLASLIAGLLLPDSGSLEIDGIPINELQRASYQRLVGYVSQDPVIFNDTLYNNVTFWAEKTSENLERFWRAIRQASLEEYVSGLAEKEETLLGNNGINLSGGQKQRVSIARELYRDVQILILDEATSALDSETEKVIQKSIEVLKGHYMLIAIAHRLSTIRNMDVITLIENGHILDSGSFDDLLFKREKFRNMARLQEVGQ